MLISHYKNWKIVWWLAPDKYKEHEGSIGKTSQRCQADHDDTLNIEHEHWVFYGLWWDEDVFMVPPHSLSQGDRLLWRRWSCWPADRSRAEICHKRGLCIHRHIMIIIIMIINLNLNSRGPKLMKYGIKWASSAFQQHYHSSSWSSTSWSSISFLTPEDRNGWNMS